MSGAIEHTVCSEEADGDHHSLKSHNHAALFGRGHFSDVYGNDGKDHPTTKTSNESASDHHPNICGPRLQGCTNSCYMLLELVHRIKGRFFSYI